MAKYSEYSKVIKLVAAALEVDMTSRNICPQCTGGEGKEHCFAVTRRVNGVQYCCHRASCGLKGFIGNDKSAPYRGSHLSKKTPHRVFTHDIRALSKEERDFLVVRYQIPGNTLDTLGFGYCESMGRYYFPIIGPIMNILGHSLKKYDGLSKNEPKVITYREPSHEKELMSWNVAVPKDQWVFIVEDQLSAAKIYSLGFNAIALIGTHLNLSRIAEIRDYFEKCVILLDADALNRAITYKNEFGALFNKCRVAVLPQKKDPKDTDAGILGTILEGLTEDDGTKDTIGGDEGPEDLGESEDAC